MEALLVSAATGALKPVLEKLASLLGDEYKRLKGVRGKIESLTHELAAMDAFLLKMSEEEDPDPQDKVWMNEVRELSYDMEDSIDDFMKHVDTKPDGVVDKLENWLGKMKAHYRVGSEIQDLNSQITKMGERNERYKTRQPFSNTKNATVDPRVLAQFEHASKLVGTDEPKKDIIKLLTEEDGSAATKGQLKLVSIVGSGGMGKTTLANQVYQELKGQFDCRAFLSVSRSPDMMNILRTILSEVSGKNYADTEAGGIQQLIGKINDFLADKRYFIVVDDIWHMDAWNVIKSALPVTSSSSRIITTTRINDVAQSCSSFIGCIYEMKPLSMVHSTQLFHRRLFNSGEDCPSYLREVSDQILKKCDGLPLAIIAISGLLANKERTEYIWNEVKDSIGRALERSQSVQIMMKILSLSYFDLSPCLKTCLLYLSIFPEDSVIKRKSLINRWICEGFIRKEDRYTAHEIGERCFNELVNRNLIQPGKLDKYDKVMNCRVHDIILDFITSKSTEENFVTLVGLPHITIGTKYKVRRLSLQGGKKEDCILLTSLVLSHVRSLNVFGNSAEMPSLAVFRRLRVLDILGCRQLENHHLEQIGTLFQLRHLNLRKTRVSKLPGVIGHLRCLEMLDLRGTAVHELPASIVNLRRLAHLFVGIHVKFPKGIAKMQALETLKRVCVFKQPLNFCQEIGQLQNLRKLVLFFGGDTSSYIGYEAGVNELIASYLPELVTMKFSSLTVSKNECICLVEPCSPAPLGLQKLMVSEPFWQVPNWVGSVIYLKELQLEVKSLEQKDVCNLGGLPALLILNLTVTAKAKGKLRVSGNVGFQSLRELCYHRVSFGGMDLMFAEGSMPKLEKLDLEFNAGESDSLSSDAFDIGIGNLPCLVTLKCEVRGWLQSAVTDAKAYLERTARAHPNHPTLFLA